MDQYELLNKEKHRTLKVRTERSDTLGDSVMNVMTYPMEFRDVQSSYPILFTKDPATGAFFASAVFGFEANQNLFLNDDQWNASYIPVMVRRQPFMIATQQTPDDGETRAVVSIDRSHPRVNDTHGEPLFLESGEPSEYLQASITLLDKIHKGLEHNRGFIDTLLRHDLLEPVTMDFSFNDGSRTSLEGFYTIAEEHLYTLDGNILGELNVKGYLQPIFMAIASLSRIRSMIEIKNERSSQNG